MTDASGGKAYSTAVASIGAGATYTTDSDDIITVGCQRAVIMLTATGANASSAGTVTFNFVANIGGSWSTSVWQSLTLTLAGTAVIVTAPVLLDVSGLSAIRVDSIVNGDATYAITNSNAIFSVPRFLM
jgi:hypothetical protein